ncbi:low-density lipoprotein receptor-like [Anneissia japonica]|uniref:low-density lipoprotein receptor-like n=1 Tax=Anneissia japonica TaxID=1529436 RepID=UPI0014255D04|nr:low-density lipoprotein receptor-like [Anneissia japonica]
MDDMDRVRGIVVNSNYSLGFIVQHSRISRFRLFNVSDIVSYPSVTWILSLAVDFPGGTVYWYDRDAEEIRASDLNLGNVRQLVSTGELGHFIVRGLAVYESSICWVSVDTAIFRADKVTGGNIQAVSDTVFENPFGLFIYNDPETEKSAKCSTPTTFPEPTTETRTDVTTDGTLTNVHTTTYITTTIEKTTDTPTLFAPGYFRKLFNSGGQEICLLDQRLNSINSLEFRSTTTCAIRCLHNSFCEGFVVNNHLDNKLCFLLDQNTIETNVTKEGCITYRKVSIV